jgi:hypothetical protein
MPADMKEGMEKSVTAKADVINWLKRSLDAVKQAHLAETSKDLQRKVHIHDRDATVDGMYLRIIVHANEHMGQLIACARMSGVVPPCQIANRAVSLVGAGLVYRVSAPPASFFLLRFCRDRASAQQFG